MNVELPTASFQMGHQPPRPGYAKRYAPQLNLLAIEIHKNTSARISMLPDRIELHGTAAFADGGTISLASELDD